MPRVQGDETEPAPALQAALAETGPGADGRGGPRQCAMVDGLHVRHAVSRPPLPHAEHPRRGRPRSPGHRGRHLDPRRPRGTHLGSAGQWRGKPDAIRLDNGPEYLPEVFAGWCKARGIRLNYIQPGKPNQVESSAYTVFDRSEAKASPARSSRACETVRCAKSAWMRQSRRSLASAKVARLKVERMPVW